MSRPVTLVRIKTFDPRLRVLNLDAAAEGFLFLDRLVEDWISGGNRFDKTGECLLGVAMGDDLVGVGGLNRDPYDPTGSMGRIRHVYVAPDYRRHGIGRVLLHALLAEAAPHYTIVRLRTDSRDAAAFYAGLGFVPVASETATHMRIMAAG